MIASDSPAALVETQRAASGGGTRWILEAWQLFTPRAGIWILIAVALFITSSVADLIPYVGDALAVFAWPFICGGIMLGCKRQKEGGAIRFADLWGAVDSHRAVLSQVAFAALALWLAKMVVYYAISGSIGAPWPPGLSDGVSLETLAGPDLIITLFVELSYYLLDAVLFFWVPYLVVVRGQPVAHAFRINLAGSVHNLWPLTWMSLLLAFLAIGTVLTLGLGMLVVYPLSVLAGFTSAEEIFRSGARPASV